MAGHISVILLAFLSTFNPCVCHRHLQQHLQHFPPSLVPWVPVPVCTGTRGGFKCYDMRDMSGEEMMESLITGGVHLGFSDLECSRVGICASLRALFANLPDYSPCAEKEKKPDLYHHCKSYRP